MGEQQRYILGHGVTPTEIDDAYERGAAAERVRIAALLRHAEDTFMAGLQPGIRAARDLIESETP